MHHGNADQPPTLRSLTLRERNQSKSNGYGLPPFSGHRSAVTVVEAQQKREGERTSYTRSAAPQRSQRPDSIEQNSFPSSHTVNAVALATVASAFQKKQEPLWYGGAALIGLSRLLLRRHRGRDVLAGSLLGYGIARLELSRRRGLFLPRLAKQVKDRFLTLFPL